MVIGHPRMAPHALAGNPYFLGLAVDSRIVRTGLKVWCCVGASGPDSRSSAAAAPSSSMGWRIVGRGTGICACLLYTSDAADE